MRSETLYGFFAADSSAYDTFHEILDPVIGEFHQCDSYLHSNTSKMYGAGAESDLFIEPSDQDLLGKRVISSRVRVARNLEEYPYSSSLSG